MSKKSNNKKRQKSELDGNTQSSALNGQSKIGKKEYEAEIFKLQVELVKLQGASIRAAREAIGEVWNLRYQAREGMSVVENTPPSTWLLGEQGSGSNYRANPFAGVRGACPEETDQKIEAENPERRQDRASRRTLRKSLRKQFGDFDWELGIRIIEPVVEVGSTH